MLKNRNILITGTTGSFGRAFTKFLLDKNVGRLVVFSRDEVKQHEMREEFKNHPNLRFFIGDVRDVDRLRRAFRGVDTVIHAAALKRIEVGFYDPEEMVKTNVLGAMNIIRAADECGVKRVVALSTDKACEPISAYGQSKALAESLFIAANNSRGSSGPTFAVTRYGNVCGSRGSIIPKWREILKKDHVVPITDFEATRFWMTMDQACDLVYEAMSLTSKESFFVPKELPAYRVGDLAMAMGAQGFVSLGLPHWEKLHESMVPGETSEHARRMSVDELREELKKVI